MDDAVIYSSLRAGLYLSLGCFDLKYFHIEAGGRWKLKTFREIENETVEAVKSKRLKIEKAVTGAIEKLQ